MEEREVARGSSESYQLGNIDARLTTVEEDVAEIKAHGKSLYGNGSGEKGYIEREFDRQRLHFYLAIAFVVMLVMKDTWHIPTGWLTGPIVAGVVVEVFKKGFTGAP